MNNEQLQAAKDQAARELYDCNYPQAILEGQLNTHTERENFLHRAIEIYAEMVVKSKKKKSKINPYEPTGFKAINAKPTKP